MEEDNQSIHSNHSNNPEFKINTSKEGKEENQKDKNDFIESDFFEPQSNEEDYPLHISAELDEKFTTLNNIIDTIYPQDSFENAREISKEERKIKDIIDKSFIYGEVIFRAIAYIFEYLKIQYEIIPGEFYDFGSGSGKAVISTMLCYSFTKYIGVEYLKGLYEMSLDAQQKFDDYYLMHLNEFQRFVPKYGKFDDYTLPKYEFINSDFLNVKVKSASVIFVYSTCFTSKLMNSLGKKFEKECKKGCIVITLTKKLTGIDTHNWDIKPVLKTMVTWGVATVFIHRKINRKYHKIKDH